MSYSDNFLEQQGAELESLTYIFDNAVRSNGNVITITLFPFFDSQRQECHTQIDLHVVCSESYPNSEPEINLSDSKGLSNQKIQILKSELEELATKLKGEVMIYQLAQHVQGFLSDNNQPATKSFYEEMVSRKEQIKQAKYKSEEDKKTRKIQDLQEKVSRKEKEALMCKENDSSDENENDAKHVRFSSTDTRYQHESSGCSLTDNESPCDHKCCKYIQFNNKVLRGRCLDHDVNSVLYWAIDSSSGEPVLIREWILRLKHKTKDGLTNIQKQLDSIHQEMNYLKKLQHDNLISYIDFKLVQEKEEWIVYILQEHISNTTINMFLSRHLSIDVKVVKYFVTGILNAVSYLHHHNVVHKNLKSSCIYFNKSGTIKVGNHSVVKRLDDVYQSCNFGVTAISKDRINPKSDIQQLGIVLLNIMGVSSSPNESIAVPDFLPPDLKDFIEKCLIENEEKRWSARQLLDHKFLKNTLSKGFRLRKNFGDVKHTLETNNEEEIEESDLLFSQSVPKNMRGQSRISDEFHVLRDLGMGSFGKVLKAKNKLDGRIYAIKEIKLNPRNKLLNRKMIREVKLLSKLNHENVVRYYNSWIETRDVDDSSLVTNVTSTPLQTLTDLHSCRALDDGDSNITALKSSDSRRSQTHDEDDEEDDDEDFDCDEYETSESDDIQSPQELDQSSYITFSKEVSELNESARIEDDPVVESNLVETNRTQIRMYIQMEFCEKSTLRTAIDDHLCDDEPRIWRLFREIVEGLTYIHEQDMIHRDLKPVNIFLDSYDHVKIGDFGLATTTVISKPTLVVTGLFPGGGGDNETSSHVVYEDSHTGAVGTSLYVAPELKKAFGKIHYNKKVDIYSLGIIFFEMCHSPFSTGMERAKTLGNLRLPEIIIPEPLEQKMPQQIELVRQLLNHDPMSRPSCEDILEGDFLPPPLVEDEELQELLRYTLSTPQSKAYKYLISSCFDQKTCIEEDITYHTEKISSEKLYFLRDSTKECIVRILKKHGAGDIPTPLLLPKSDIYTNVESCVKLMTHSGSIVSLPYDLRVPFARHVVRKDITRLRRYTVDRVYREKKAHGFHPKELYECAFDIVTPSPGNFVADSEMLSVINEIVNHLPSLRNRNCLIRINHTHLLKAILINFGAGNLYSEIYRILIDSKENKYSRNKLEATLLSLPQLGDQVIMTLITIFQKEDALNKIAHDFFELVNKREEARSMAKKAFQQLKTMISGAEYLGLNIPVKVALGVVNNVEYSSGMMFDFVCDVKQKRKKEGSDILASGCRYDGLLAKFRKVFEQTGATPISQSAVGMSIFLDKLANFLKDEDPMSESIVVCSLGQSAAVKPKAELMKTLWASGIKGFVVENIDTLEELQSYCQENNVMHIITLKESESGFVRVRSWDKGRERYQEKKMNVSEVVTHVAMYSKTNIESSEPNAVMSQRQDSKGSTSIASTGAPNIHVIAEDKMSASSRRKYETQIASKMYPLLDVFSSRRSIEIIGLFLEESAMKHIALNFEMDDDLKDYSKDFLSVIEKSNKKKYLTKICDKIHSLYTEKSNITITGSNTANKNGPVKESDNHKIESGQRFNQEPFIALNSGYHMPIFGLGTGGELPVHCKRHESDVIRRIERGIDAALRIGYRHFDTHVLFQTEPILGKVLKTFLDCDVVKRNDLFVSSKLALTKLRPHQVCQSVCNSLKNLNLDYLDLMLIPHPVGLIERGCEMIPTDDCGYARIDPCTDLVAVWKAMEAEVDAGRVRSIGLSNFNSKQICRILENARIKPANLQIELHLYFQQKQLVEFCRQHDISVTSYATLGAPHLIKLLHINGISTEKVPRIYPLCDPTVIRIAFNHKKRPEHVLLRHLIQKNVAVIPKSFDPSRLCWNFRVFDFCLTPSEMEELDSLDQGCRCRLYRETIKGTSKHPEWPFENESY